MIEVELPDGTIAEFPEGTAPDVIKGALQKRFAAPAPVAPVVEQKLQRSDFRADPVATTALDGYTFGLGDSITSGINAAIVSPFSDKTFGEVYDAEQADKAKAMQYLQENSPKTAMAASVLPAILSGAGLAKSGITLAGRGAPALMTGLKGLAARSGLMAAEGAGYGAVNALGHDEDVLTGAGYGAIGGGLGNVAGEWLSAGLSKILGAFNKAPQQMGVDELKSAAQAAYSKADQAGVIYKPEAVKRISDALKGEFADFGYHPELQSGAKVALGELDRIGGQNVTFKGLDTARKVAGNAYQPMNKSNNALTAKVASAIDDLVQNPQAGDILAGDNAAASAAIKEARDMYSRGAKLEKVQYLLGKAGRNAASAGSGGNIQNATKQQLKTLLTNPKNTRGFKPDELKALEKAVMGTKTQDLLRRVGKLSPQGNGLMMALGAGSAVASPAIAIPTMIAGTIAKKGAEGMTRANVRALESVIANGGTAIKATKNTAQKAIEGNKDAIIRALMMSGVLAGSQAGQP